MQKYFYEFKQMVKSFRYLVSVILTAFLCFGFTISHVSYSPDDTNFTYYYGKGIELLNQNRFTQVLIDKILGIMDFRPFFLDFLAVICLCLAAIFWCVLFKVVTKGRLNQVCYIVFSCFFISFPMFHELFVYMVVSFPACLAHMLIPISLMFVNEFFSKKKIKYIVGSAIIMAITIPIYESISVNYLFGIFVVLILRQLFSGQLDILTALKQGITFLIPLVVGVIGRILADKIIHTLISFNHASVAATNINWFENSFVDTVKSLIASLKADYWTVSVASIAIEMFVMSIFVYAFLSIFHSVKDRSVVTLLLYIVGFISIFALSLIEGTAQPYRTNLVMPLFVAFTFMLLFNTVASIGHRSNEVKKTALAGKIIKSITGIVLVIMLFWQVNDLNKWFYIDWMCYEEQKRTVNEIGFELLQYDRTKPIVFVGRYPLSNNINQYLYFNREENITFLGRLVELVTNKNIDLQGKRLTQTGVNSLLEVYGGGVYLPGSEDISEVQKLFLQLGWDFIPGDFGLYNEELPLTLDKPQWPKEGSIFETDKAVVVIIGNS